MAIRGPTAEQSLEASLRQASPGISSPVAALCDRARGCSAQTHTLSRRGSPTAFLGSLGRRGLLQILVSPLARTDGSTATVPASRSTSAQVRAGASSVRTRPAGARPRRAANRCWLPGPTVCRSWTAWSLPIHGLGGAACLALGDEDRAGDVAADLVAAWACRMARSRIWWISYSVRSDSSSAPPPGRPSTCPARRRSAS